MTEANKNINIDINMFREVFVNFNTDLLKDKTLNDKWFLIVSYIWIHASRSGILNTTLAHIALSIGYKLNRNENKINDVIKAILIMIINQDYITVYKQFDNNNDNNINDSKIVYDLKPKDLFQIQINANNNLCDVKSNFVQITETEFIQLTQSKIKVDRGTLFKVFLVIKSTLNNDDSKGAKIGYPSMERIKKMCNVKSKNTVDNAIENLKNIKILYEHITGSYFNEDTQKWRNAINVYALSQEELDKVNCDEVVISYYSYVGVIIDHFEKTRVPNMRNKCNSIDVSRDDSEELSEEEKNRCLEMILNSDDDTPDIDKIDTSTLFDKDDKSDSVSTVWGEPKSITYGNTAFAVDEDDLY